jgi:hypothetical protein
MNTFSDLQAIDLELALWVQPMGNPLLKISINDDVVYHGNLAHLLEIRRQLPLLQPFAVTVELLDKDYHSNQETAVVIKQLTVDGFELIPQWNHVVHWMTMITKMIPPHIIWGLWAHGP